MVLGTRIPSLVYILSMIISVIAAGISLRCRPSMLSTSLASTIRIISCKTAPQTFKNSHSKTSARLFSSTENHVPVSLSGIERSKAVDQLQSNGWKLLKDRDAVMKQFKFKNFVEAFSFMTNCAFYAEQLQHHPEWSNVYNNVDITLTTHDCNGLSSLDIQLATLIDIAASKYNH